MVKPFFYPGGSSKENRGKVGVCKVYQGGFLSNNLVKTGSFKGITNDNALPFQHNCQIASVQWSPIVPEIIAIGDYDNTVSLWNVEKQAQIRSMAGHTDRVGSLAWNEYILSRLEHNMNRPTQVHNQSELVI
eukprot:sb/3474946/